MAENYELVLTENCNPLYRMDHVNSGGCILLSVGADKLRGWILLLVGARKSGSWRFLLVGVGKNIECNLHIINKIFCVFPYLDFHVKSIV